MNRNRLIVLVATFSTTLICICVVIVVALYKVVPDYLDTRTARQDRTERSSDEDRDVQTEVPIVIETVIVEFPTDVPYVLELTEELSSSHF